jgi:hypothetical protein
MKKSYHREAEPDADVMARIRAFRDERDWMQFHDPKNLAQEDGTWEHEEITLEPLNAAFQPIVLTAKEEGDVVLAAEFVGTLR